MPGRGNGGANAGGRGRGNGWPRGEGREIDQTGLEGQDQHGRSESSPGHLKRNAGSESASDYAPGHGGTAPGQVGREGSDGESA